jgi:hypothetical protein
MRINALVSLAGVLLALVTAPRAQDGSDFAGWEVLDPGGRIMPYLGRQSLFLDRGVALMPRVAFADGTIDFDVAVHGQFGFAGVLFRAASADDFELIYLRTHRSRQWDALQYTPIFRGQESWQLYAGEGYTAAAEFPANRWVHIRVVVDAGSAEVFVDGAAAPQLVVRDLKREWRSGRVGLWGRGGAASFANVIVRPADRARPALSHNAAAAGLITHWSISQSLAASGVDLSRIPDALGYEPITSESSGLLNIARHRSPAAVRPADDDGRDIVFAKAVLRTPRQLRARMFFGYSDDVVVFVDGRRVFTGRSGYLFRDGSDLGTMSVDAAALDLELTPGSHEIVFAVIEAFGGWGIAARIENAPDITVEPSGAVSPRHGNGQGGRPFSSRNRRYDQARARG